MLKSLAPDLMVENITESLAFYTGVLGFEKIMAHPQEGEPVWAMIKSGDVRIMLEAKQGMQKSVPGFDGISIGASLTLFIETDDVDGLYAEIKDKVEIVKDIETTFYGMREVAIKDIDGYVLVFAQHS